MTTFGFMVNRWLGVSGSGYCEGFMVFTASGLQLTMTSASIMKVFKDSTSSWVPCLANSDAKTFLTYRI